MTYLEIVNALLRRLRFPVVSSVAANDYSRMLGELANQAKREVEDAYNWLSLEGTVTISTSQGTSSYVLTGFGRRSRVERVHNTTTAVDVSAVDYHRMTRELDFVSQGQNQPDWWRLNGLSGDDPIIEFLPDPDQTYTVKVYGIVPQADLENDTDILTVASWPVVLGAYNLAVAERGDDRGGSLDFAQREYQSALSDAIAHDNINRHAGHSSDWRVE